MGLLDRVRPARRDRRGWRDQERGWATTARFPPVVVRSYRSEAQARRDARRLRGLGYGIRYERLERHDRWRWYVTYARREGR
jgi:hypothetical protein